MVYWSPALILAISLAHVVRAGSSCVAFDISWNLLAFGFNGKDYNAGTMDTWSSGVASSILSSIGNSQSYSFTRYCHGYHCLRPAVSETLNWICYPTQTYSTCSPFNSPNTTCYLSQVCLCSVAFHNSTNVFNRCPSSVYQCSLRHGR